MSLRPYQSEATEALRRAVAAGYRRIVLVSPTGSGKTEMGFDVVRRAVGKGKRVGFIANRIHLVEQTSRRLHAASLEHGIVQGQNSRREYMNLLVCSVQTLARRKVLDKIGQFDVLVVDEAHTSAGSSEYRELIAQHKDKVIIGLTATPFSKGMAKHFDEVGGALWETTVIAAHYSELIAQRYLVDCDCYAPSEPDMSPFKARKNAAGELDYSDEDAGSAMSTPKLVGDIVEHWQRLAAGTPTVCFASTIAHSKMIVERFQSVGVRAEHIDCYTNDDERRAILKRVADGETTIISNVGILCEGWDFPACATMILARPTRSLIRYMQMAGRILRPAPGKDRALILDHSGTVTRLGFPTDDREYELDDGKPKESSGSSQDDEQPKLSACPKCGHVDPRQANPCPKCGHRREFKPKVVEESAGKLEKLSRATMVDKQSWYEQLSWIARDSGYRSGWVANQYRAKFGVWPRGMVDRCTTPSPEVSNWVKSQRIRYAKSKERLRA